MSDQPEIDWSVFDGLSEQTLTCACDVTFRSHAKAIFDGPHRGVHARTPCPGCGRTDAIRRASTDPEEFTIR